MQTSLFSGDIAQADVDAIIIGHLKDTPLTGAAARLNEACGGLIAELIESGDLGHKAGRIRQLYRLPGVRAQRVLVIGVGEAEKFGLLAFQKAVRETVSRLLKSPAMRVVNALPELPVKKLSAAEKLFQAGVVAQESLYVYRETKEQPEVTGLDEMHFAVDGEADADLLRQAEVIGRGVNRARELGNLPPNICNPAYLEAVAGEIAGSHDRVELEVLDEARMQEMGMGALLAVGRGSANRPRMIVLRYQGAGKDQAPHVLVGKGITFDTGGISLKPGASMDEMKYDMCGAASVIGAFQAVVELGLPINLVTIVPAVENMPDGNSYRPGDVLKSYAGKTIEVLNTDAEGRLILCDALAYGKEMNPASMIDVATLTGACVIALGHHASGLMTHDDELAEALLDAGRHMGDRAWRLPLWDDYQSQIESPFADLANVGGREAGSITAGRFLSCFTEGVRWAHLDIAGSAWKSGKNRDATGRPVKLLVEYLRRQAD